MQVSNLLSEDTAERDDDPVDLRGIKAHVRLRQRVEQRGTGPACQFEIMRRRGFELLKPHVQTRHVRAKFIEQRLGVVELSASSPPDHFVRAGECLAKNT